MIQPLSPNRVHPQINSSLRLLALCLVRPDLFVILCCFFFSKDSFLSLATLTNATPAFSTLWFVIRKGFRNRYQNERVIMDLVRLKEIRICLFGVLRRINSISVICILRRQLTSPFFLDYFLTST